MTHILNGIEWHFGTRNSALALRAACARVLSVHKGWEEIDVASIDVEDTIRRFKNLRSHDFNPASLEAYCRRFRNAVASFLEYAKDPTSWKLSTRSRSLNAKSQGQRTDRKNNPPVKKSQESLKNPVGVLAASGLIEYPFPIRDTHVARLQIPRDITTAEVKRLHRFLLALAVDKGKGN